MKKTEWLIDVLLAAGVAALAMGYLWYMGRSGISSLEVTNLVKVGWPWTYYFEEAHAMGAKNYYMNVNIGYFLADYGFMFATIYLLTWVKNKIRKAVNEFVKSEKN